MREILVGVWPCSGKGSDTHEKSKRLKAPLSTPSILQFNSPPSALFSGEKGIPYPRHLSSNLLGEQPAHKMHLAKLFTLCLLSLRLHPIHTYRDSKLAASCPSPICLPAPAYPACSYRPFVACCHLPGAGTAPPALLRLHSMYMYWRSRSVRPTTLKEEMKLQRSFTSA